MFAEMTTKIKANRFLAARSIAGKRELFLYFYDLKNISEVANNMKC